MASAQHNSSVSEIWILFSMVSAQEFSVTNPDPVLMVSAQHNSPASETWTLFSMPMVSSTLITSFNVKNLDPVSGCLHNIAAQHKKSVND